MRVHVPVIMLSRVAFTSLRGVEAESALYASRNFDIWASR